MKPTQGQFVALQDVLQDTSTGEFCDDYSGRGMYGKTCLGLRLDAETSPFLAALDLMVALTDAGLDAGDARTVLKTARTDAMGRGTILYWPSFRTEVAEESDSNV